MLYFHYQDMVLFTDKNEDVLINPDGTLTYIPTAWSFVGESIDAEEVEDINQVLAYFEAQYAIALALVKKAFRGKKDKAGKPYIHHLLAVANSVESYQEKIVALLFLVLSSTNSPFVLQLFFIQK